MKNEKLRISILLSLQRALLGNVSSHVRMICCDWESKKWFKLRVYLDIEANAEEKELISIVLTEFESDIEFDNFYEEYIYSKENIYKLDYLKIPIYIRHEGVIL